MGFNKGRTRLNSSSSLWADLIRGFYWTPFGCQVGIHKTFTRILTNIFKPRMRKDVKTFVIECMISQTIKYRTTKPTGCYNPYHPWPSLWRSYHGFNHRMLLSNGKSFIMVVIDRLTKLNHFGALRTNFIAISFRVVNEYYCQNSWVFRGHGFW